MAPNGPPFQISGLIPASTASTISQENVHGDMEILLDQDHEHLLLMILLMQALRRRTAIRF